MRKKYRFVYKGTLGDFNNAVRKFEEDCRYGCYHYLFAEIDGKYSFGILRTTHTGGYWFEPEYKEIDDELVIEGNLRFADCMIVTCGDKIRNAIEIIIFSPLLLISLITRLMIILVKKICGKDTAKDEVKALFCLMTERLGCKEEKI